PWPTACCTRATTRSSSAGKSKRRNSPFTTKDTKNTKEDSRTSTRLRLLTVVCLCLPFVFFVSFVVTRLFCVSLFLFFLVALASGVAVLAVERLAAVSAEALFFKVRLGRVLLRRPLEALPARAVAGLFHVALQLPLASFAVVHVCTTPPGDGGFTSTVRASSSATTRSFPSSEARS